MATYLAFSEGEAISGANWQNSSTTGGVDEAGVNRCGFRSVLGVSQPTGDATLSSPLQEGFFHCRFAMATENVTNGGGKILTFKDTSGAELFAIKYKSGARDTIGFSSVNGIGEEDCWVRDNPVEFDVHFRISDGTDGFLRFYADGVLVYEESGITNASTGDTQVETITWLQQNRSDSDPPVGEANQDHYSQVIVSDVNTIGAKLYTLTPTAGATNDWANGSVTDVDEEGVDDSDFISTDTDNDQFTYDTSVTLSDTTGVNSYTSLVQTFRGSYDSGASVTKLTPFLNDTTATSTSFATSKSLTTGTAFYQESWETDPADSSEWTATKINNYEFGLQADT